MKRLAFIVSFLAVAMLFACSPRFYAKNGRRRLRQPYQRQQDLNYQFDLDLNHRYDVDLNRLMEENWQKTWQEFNNTMRTQKIYQRDWVYQPHNNIQNMPNDFISCPPNQNGFGWDTGSSNMKFGR